MHRTWWVALFMVCGLAAPSSSFAEDLSGRVLLFTASFDGKPDLVLSTTEGLVRLTSTPGGNNWGRWSLDGRKIAFQSQRDGNYEVYLMDADGSNPTNLSQHAGHDGLPAWSPDGRRIAFFSSRGLDTPRPGPIPGHVYVLDLASGDLSAATRAPLPSTLGPSSWSPSGCCVLVARFSDVGSVLLELDLASGEERELIASPSQIGGGLYSPDGERVAYYEEDDETAVVRLLERATGKESLALSLPGHAYPYAWSPDGGSLLVTHYTEHGSTRLLAVGTEAVVDVTPAGMESAREASWRPSRPGR